MKEWAFLISERQLHLQPASLDGIGRLISKTIQDTVKRPLPHLYNIWFLNMLGRSRQACMCDMQDANPSAVLHTTCTTRAGIPPAPNLQCGGSF